MLKQTDFQGRLRLFRYGIIAIVVITFFVVLFFPYNQIRTATNAGSITDFLGQAILATVIAAVIGGLAYVGYYYMLLKKFPWDRSGVTASSGTEKPS
jgi:hypothetical protein